MNSKQRTLLFASILLFVGMILFPPWTYFDGNTSNQGAAGYHFVHSPPSLSTPEEMFGIPSSEMSTEFVRVKLNGLRLIGQEFVLVFLTAGLYKMMKGRESLLAISEGIGPLIVGLMMLLALIFLVLTSNGRV